MQILKPNIIFFSIILIIGMFTTITDLKSQKIYNDHLLIGTFLGLLAIIFTAVFKNENVLFHIINGLIAFILGYFLHRFKLWRGGDAKLFVLYAFLMPALERNHILLSSAINLFACSFISGMIILLPFFLKDIASNYSTLFNKFLLHNKHETLFNAINITIFFSWILFPVYYFAGIIHLPAISLALTYLIFYLAHRFIRKLEATYLLIASGIIFGFFMRLWLNPHSLSLPILTYSIFKIGLFSTISAGIYTTLDLFKEYHDRIPFAPLLFIGCILSYSPLLTWIINIVAQR